MTKGKGSGPHRRFWRQVRDWYFTGTTNTTLLRILEPLHAEITVTKSRARGTQALAFALTQLSADQLVLLRIVNGRVGLDHWVLAVGIAGRVDGGELAIEHLLLLDPAHPALPLAAWNSVLIVEQTQRRRTYRVVDADGNSYHVSLISAVAVGRA